LGYGWVRLDTDSPYHIESGFSGGGLWSVDYQAVVGIVGKSNDRGDGQALTLREIAALMPEAKLDLLKPWLAETSTVPSDEPMSRARPGPATESTTRPRRLAGTTADTVPEPGEGRVRAADRLGTAADVDMLVSVLLARDTPLPLAVGLFGDWGSGKSFFMALMQERIAELADLAGKDRPEAEPFCRDVRQIRFNAWHYIDTNLWASLAATLFDELAQLLLLLLGRTRPRRSRRS
jgi:hypothetical protein